MSWKVVTITVDENAENIQAGSVKFVSSDCLNIATIGKKVKHFEIVVINSGADSDLYNKFGNKIGQCILWSDSRAKDIDTKNPDVVMEPIFIKMMNLRLWMGLSKG